jgi:uncharacterized iron-regulated membrane protein
MTPARRLLLAAHRWLGLLLALPLAAVALSGGLLAAGKPVDAWMNRHLFHAAAPAPSAAGGTLAIDAAHAELSERYGPQAGFTLRLPQEPHESLRVFVRAEHFSGMAFYDPASGRWLGQRGDTEGWWPWLFELHSNALIGDRGKAILSIVAAAALLLAVLGAVLWWPRQGGNAFGVVWRAPALRRWRDLHRVGGALVLPLLLAVLMSGVYMSWTPIRAWISQAAGEPPVKPPRLPAAPAAEGAGAGAGAAAGAGAGAAKAAPLSALVAAALAPWPEGRVVYVMLRSGQPVRVRVKLPHDPHPNGLSSTWFDPRDGHELARVRVDELDTGQRWVSWIYPLHSAQLVGPAQRLVWALVSGVLLALAGSGIWLWWRRRRLRVRAPSPAARAPLR